MGGIAAPAGYSFTGLGLVQCGLLAVAAVFGAAYIIALDRQRSGPLVIVVKVVPVALVALLAGLWLTLPLDGGQRTYVIVILAGLAACAAGDILIGPVFLGGLGAFLVGHLFYIAAFATRLDASWQAVVAGVVLAVYAVAMGRKLAATLAAKSQRNMIPPVIAYLTIIWAMCLAALMTANPVAIAGALAFLASDSMLAWNMFVGPVPRPNLAVMGTYYAAQALIAASLLAA
jgi:uncharacterized membrane protein YhhN